MRSTRFQLQTINPLRGLNIPKLVRLIEQGELGYYARLQWLFRFVEKRDPIVRAVKKRLLAALGSLAYSVKVSEEAKKDPGKDAMAKRQAATLSAAYDKIENLREALNFLALAELRGYSHLEKIYQRYDSAEPDAWDVIELRIVEQWFWCRDGLYGPWMYNEDARETNRGDLVDLSHYVIHSIDDPVGEIFAELTVKRKVSDSDWDGYLEDYGIPPLFIVLPPDVPKEKEREYQDAAERAVSAARGSLPHGSQLTSPSAGGSGGAGVFKERLDYIDEQIVIAGTSGKLTVLAESGSGTLAGGAQKDAFDEIAQAIADQISSVMQRQFDLPILSRVHPNEPVLAYFEFAAVDSKDVAKHADNAVKFGQAGYAIDDAELSEKSGYKLRYVGAQAAHTNRPDGTKPIGLAGPGADAGKDAGAAPAKSAGASTTPGDQIAKSISVAPEFVAPGKQIIDNLLALAADDNVGVDELTAAAEDLLKTIPELAEQTDIGSVVDALQLAMQTAAEEILGGATDAK